MYGANASGKSNFLDALAKMRYLVETSAQTQINVELEIEPFLLCNSNKKKPSYFEVIFNIGSIKYRYGFEANNENIITEWLFQTKRVKEYPLFVRERDKFQITDRFKEGFDIEDKTRNNALFVSVVSQFNGKISKTIVEWFNDSLKMFHGVQDKEYFSTTAEMLSNKKMKKLIISFMKYADLGINDLELIETKNKYLEFEKMLDNNSKNKYKEALAKLTEKKYADIVTYHDVFDDNDKVSRQTKLSLTKHGSEGTKKFSSDDIILESLIYGKILVIDEIDTRLHPLITRLIVDMFNSAEGNPYNAQLIFTTHDTNLLDKDVFRRDQIYFTEKDKTGGTHLYSLLEYKPRNDEAYEKNYIKGKYGGIPFLGDRILQIIFQNKNGKS
ncbi:MAG: ATP-binding protein [Flavobacteriaceae bacterium]